MSARCTYGEAVRFPDEPSEEPCEARSQEGARELRSVSTDRRSLPKAVARVMPQGPVRGEKKSCSGCFQSQNARVKNGDAPHITRLHAFRGLGEDGGFMYFRVPRRRRSCPGAAKEPEWAAGTRRHRRDDSTSVAHRAKEEVSSRVAASPRRIGSADPSSRLGSWSRVAPRLPIKTPKSRNLCGETAHRNSAMRSSRRLRAILTTPHLRDHSGRSRQYATSSLIRPSTGRSEPSSASDSSM